MADIINSILEDGSFKNLFAAIQAAEMIDTLRGSGPYTLFAPEDYAFANLSSTMDEIMKDPIKLKAFVMYHIVEGKLTAEKMSKMSSATTLQGQEVTIDAHQWHLHVDPKINGANITSRDNLADNGVIHILDKVLMPNMDLTCPVCGTGFMTMEVLDIHTRTAHGAEKMIESMSDKDKLPEA